ncbi:MAG TPA: hypothetical protein VKR83_06845 [Ktedonobacteraceae bacterium]|nr:hypothetical protein [Ktedonobacteraceae bacterium]
MTHYGTWSPYAGSNSIILAVGLFLVTGVLMYFAMRLHHPLAVKGPGRFLSVALIGIWVLFVTTFLVAASIYARADEQQMIHFTGPMNPIAPVTQGNRI